MSLQREIIDMAKKARAASRVLAAMESKSKDISLLAMADNIKKKRSAILKANAIDVKNAGNKGISQAMIERLTLSESRIAGMIEGLRDVAALRDEIGIITEMVKRPNGLWIGKMRVPIGVIALIYEARPNVTSDCVSLTIKSGNSVILKGGSEALNSNLSIFKALNEAAIDSGLPEGAINLISTADRKAVSFLLRQDRYVDLVIPRGGEGLIREITKKSRIPVIKHYKGVCHVYVDEFADMNMAHNIAINAKVQRPSVCNAMETLLVHKDIAARFLPVVIADLRKDNVEIRGCRRTRRIVRGVLPAKESDWYAEYLDLILSVKVVSSVEEAIEHITKYGSMHSDSIITENHANAMEFLKRVDTACVFLNASTRFSDGGQFGMGAEIGISTDKLHARGPMGLKELTSYKYVIFGEGQIRS